MAVTDFLYQVNRPRQLDLGDQVLKINRLSKWAVNTHTLIQIGPEGANYGAPHHSIQLELDINTDPERRDRLESEEQQRIFRHLIGFAREIARQGNRP